MAEPPGNGGGAGDGEWSGRGGDDPFAGGFSADRFATDAGDPWEALRAGLGAAGAAAHAHAGGELRCVELCPICRGADLLRAGGPPELRGQLADFQREALLTLRAVLDHYLDRLDARPGDADRVEDIPIE